jgi:hypothetical protein
MNILTKISVVVLAVLLVLCCAAVLAYNNTTANYRWESQGKQQQLDLSTADRAQMSVALLKAKLEIAERTERLNAAQSKLSADTSALSRQLDDERAKSADQAVKLGGMKTTLEKLEADLQAKEQRNERLLADLNASNAKVNEKADENRRLGDQIKEQMALVERSKAALTYQVGLLREAEEKVRILENEVRAKGGIAKRTDDTGAQVPTPPGDILGTVSAVDAANAIAAINCGSAKGVKVGMVANVSRGSEYVCRIRITDVNMNDAAGPVVLPKMAPAVGDKFEIPSER